MSRFFEEAKSAIEGLVHGVEGEISNIAGLSNGEKHSHTHVGEACHALHIHGYENRFGSFAPPRNGHDIKWHIDGCAYMWAVSVALEEAQESIWILDWWLTPELYLRRPPSANEEYRIDRMLLAAAERGVKVNIIVYKEVTKVLTCMLYLHFWPHITWTNDYISMLRAHQAGFRGSSQHLSVPSS